MEYRLALHIVFRRKVVTLIGDSIVLNQYRNLAHGDPLFLQKQSVLYADMLNSKPVTHSENSVTARIYLPIKCACPHGSKG